MMKRAALALLLVALPAGAAEDPAAAVNAFYEVYANQHAQGGIPDATVRVRFAPVLSPRLTAKVRNAVPPMLEGDIFSSLFEGATTWKVGACVLAAKTAHCPVALTYAPPATSNAKAQKPANWNDTVVVVSTPQGWKVDDVIYDAGFAFGNTGRLSAMLQMVVTANP